MPSEHDTHQHLTHANQARRKSPCVPCPLLRAGDGSRGRGTMLAELEILPDVPSPCPTLSNVFKRARGNTASSGNIIRLARHGITKAAGGLWVGALIETHPHSCTRRIPSANITLFDAGRIAASRSAAATPTHSCCESHLRSIERLLCVKCIVTSDADIQKHNAASGTPPFLPKRLSERIAIFLRREEVRPVRFD